MDKRTFVKTLAAGSFGSSPLLKNLDRWLSEVTVKSPAEVAKDEDFWRKVRSAYDIKEDYINLESGYYSIIPQETLENYISHIRQVNREGSYYMRTVQWENKIGIHKKLSELVNANEGEVVLTRNTTESLDTIIGGFPWKTGDEAVYASQDYGAMQQMFELVAERHGVVNKEVSVPNHPKSDEEIVDLYRSAITSKTRLLMICHMINITGHILPVRKICDMAHSLGVEVMVDGAHAIGHIPVDVKALDCDYYGSSLHKWLSVPLGAGLLYVRKSKIPQIWPLFAELGREPDDIRRLNHTGTHPVATDLAVADAINFYQKLGPERKESRLRYLQRYWTDQVRDVPGINVNTPIEPHRSCGIANVGIAGLSPGEMAKRLLEEYKVWTVGIDRPPVVGCRITPNVFTTIEELDVFVAALKGMAKG